MSYIIGPHVIKYACSCGLLKPISHLYFCRYCCQLRCGFCVCHEVDSHFCGKCCENIPSAEVRLKHNRCSNCYICPSCHQELSTRIGTKTVSDDPKSTPKKMHYLCCLNCRWSSRDVGIPDQSSVTGGWPERENVHSVRLQELIDFYKALVVADKTQKEKERKKQRGKFMTYTERTGVTAASMRKRLGMVAETPISLRNKPKVPEPVTAKAEVEGLPDDIFTKPVNLMEVTTLEQRFLQPELQPMTVDKLFPIKKQLSVKRSLRCRACEHNVSKPEYNPNSVKFKIQLFAYYHIPEIRLVTVEPLRAGQPAELILKFTNPTQHQTTICFEALNLTDEEVCAPETVFLEAQETAKASLPSLATAPDLALGAVTGGGGSQPSSLLSLSARHPSITVKPRAIIQVINADVELPTEGKVILPPRDDAAEYDDSGDTHNIQDDPKLVVRRKSNKAWVRLMVTPKEDLALNTPLTIAFTMTHIYTNTIAVVENKDPDKHAHKVKVFVTVGNLVGSE